MAIAVEDVSFCYDGEPVLESVSFAIPKGCIWALIGRSGVGKTTLLHMIAGLFTPQTGKVSVGTEQDRIKGVVFQEECLLGWLSVEQNILFPFHRNPTQSARDRAREVLREVGLSGIENCLPFTLSVGMRKRVEFARALIVDDNYLLADEPFGTVDALTRRDLWQLWRNLRLIQRRTGILSTHDPEEAIRLCDAILPLVPGPPARLGSIITIPEDVMALSVDRTNESLIRLKERVVEALS